MSTRTIIEINHDHLRQLRDEVAPGGSLDRLLRALWAADTQWHQYDPAVRILGQRHHSETLELKVE